MRIFKSSAALRLALVLTLATAFVPLAAPRVSLAFGGKTISQAAPTTTALKIVSGDGSITHVTVINYGSVTAFLGNSSTVTAIAGAATDGEPIFQYGVTEFDGITDDVWAITASGTADLRVEVIKGGGVTRHSRLSTTGISNSVAANEIPMSDGASMVNGNARFLNLTTAITPNSTSTTTAAGTFAVTSNATGRNSIFRSDGSLWQLLSTYSDFSQSANLGTVATTGNTDDYLVAAYAGTLVSLDCSSNVALTANDTNYLTFTLTNLGAAGGGSTAMLAATAPNTTQATGGTGFGANAKRSLTVSGTGANLVVAAGDRMLLRFAATGTLANTLTTTKCVARFNRLS